MYKNRLDYPVSLFRNRTDRNQPTLITISALMKRLMNYDEFDTELRLAATTNTKKYQTAKNKLECIVLGQFSTRKASACEVYTPCLCFDIDKIVDSDTTLKLQRSIESLDYVFAVYPSISNLGLRVLIWTDASKETHKEYYKSLFDKLSKDIPSTFDESYTLDPSTKDVSRLWFITPLQSILEFYINVNSKTYTMNAVKSLEANTNVMKDPFQKCIDIIESRNVMGRNNFVMQLSRLSSEYGIPKATIQAHCLSLVSNASDDYFPEKEVYDTIDKNYLLPSKDIEQLHNYHNKISETKPHKTSKNEDKSKFHKLVDFIENNYSIRLDIFSKELEYKKAPSNKFEPFNRETLECHLYENHFSNFGNMLNSILGSDKYVLRFNPLEEYLKSLPKWTPEMPDYIEELSTFVVTDDDEFWRAQFKKTLVRCLSNSLNLTPFNKQVLCLVAESQNIGKTSFIRFLCPSPLKRYMQEYFPLKDKDSYKALGNNLFINLDEVYSFNSKDLGALKSWISKDSVKIRLPFAKYDATMPRIANFFATTNEEGLLTDSENVRWLVFRIKSINHDNGKSEGYSQNIDIDKVYAQASYLLNNQYDFDISSSEMKYMESRNKKYFSKSTSEQEYLSEYFRIPKIDDDGKYISATFCTAAKIETYVRQLAPNIRTTNIKIGKALSKLGYPKDQLKIDGQGIKGYQVDLTKLPSHIII